MTEILSGIHVVELAEAMAGPYCAMLLGDFGADVIKIERPRIGDQTRGWGPPFIAGESAYFLSANRNKRSVTLNYHRSRDAEALQKLLDRADIFIVNQASLTSLKKRGLDFDTLHARNPRLIYCAISGYGFTGPNAGRPGYDILAQAETGVMSFTGEPDGGPMRCPVSIADITCGMYSAMGILAALYSREKTGAGQFLDMALFDAQLTWLANIGSNYLNADVSPQRLGNAHPSIVPYEMFRGGDGRHFVVGVGTEAIWKRFVGMIGVESGIGSDARFETNALRNQNRSILIPVLQKLFEQHAASEWLEELRSADIPAAPINTVAEALSSPQTQARNLIVQLEHPAMGIASSIANPIKFSATPVSYRLPPPLLGEHTRAILEGLGYSAKDTQEMATDSAAQLGPQNMQTQKSKK